MSKLDKLRDLGLFDARVPRYTSYPPADRFEPDTGRHVQADWVSTAPPTPLSIYVHIPFCRRLYWFCACRTQGTQSAAPVEAYLGDLIAEIRAVAGRLPPGPRMARLHLGGGTPTLLSAHQMDRLLAALHDAFAPTDDFEFSVEIDPTEAAPDVMAALGAWHLTRASIGIQDFAPDVQAAIGRHQSASQTQRVADQLRSLGVESLNLDLLYGLPHQTEGSLLETLRICAALEADRVALYGYAHVPHVAKRQRMIDAATLAGGEDRYRLSLRAADAITAQGHTAIGIDHFARPEDGLARAAQTGTLRRNFQGYTDDPCATQIGFGASAISRFAGGYIQNAVATGAYRSRVAQTGLAAHRGYALSQDDRIIARMIEMLMCAFAIDIPKLCQEMSITQARVHRHVSQLLSAFDGALNIDRDKVHIRDDYTPLVRIIAAALDSQRPGAMRYSTAI